FPCRADRPTDAGTTGKQDARAGGWSSRPSDHEPHSEPGDARRRLMPKERAASTRPIRKGETNDVTKPITPVSGKRRRPDAAGGLRPRHRLLCRHQRRRYQEWTDRGQSLPDAPEGQQRRRDRGHHPGPDERRAHSMKRTVAALATATALLLSLLVA